MDIQEINNLLLTNPTEAVRALTYKAIEVPSWDKLEKEYDSSKHPVCNRIEYKDIETKHGTEKVTRVTSDLIKLSVTRMAEMMFGVDVKRISKPENDKQKDIALYLENIFRQCRINSVNLDRGKLLFSACEVVTLWYQTDSPNNIYGFNSPIKLHCRNYAPSKGDQLYPYFDEYEDLKAISIKYTRKVLDKTETFFDAYTADMHVKLQQGERGWEILEKERISIGKIPAIYMYRPTPIWEKTADKVYEIEWTLSRNGNYIRKNSKPLFGLFCDEEIPMNESLSENQEFREIIQLPRGSSAQYITWPDAGSAKTLHIDKMEELFWKELQLPDWSYEKMKSTPMSGEARKQLFVDACMKVREESGRVLEFLDREISILKSFLKIMLPSEYSAEIDKLQISSKITPFTMTDWSDKIQSLSVANGGEAMMSLRESIVELGHSSDPDATLEEIEEQKRQSATEMTI